MNALLSKRSLITIANVYIKDGDLIKYRFSSLDKNNPDYILGESILPLDISLLDEKCKKRLANIKDRVIIENESGISFIGFNNLDLNSLLLQSK